MDGHTYLVFGDLHGRILPAFRLAIAWSREFGVPVTSLLQVGDLGYFPDLARLDKATRRHAERDPAELGAQDVVNPNPLADAIFADPLCPGGLWFTAGNHEDHDDLCARSSAAGRSSDFPVDAYLMVRCVRDGYVAELPGGLRVGALWGVDGEQPGARRKLPPAAYVRERSANNLRGHPMDVLLTHDAPLDAARPGHGSETIARAILTCEPRFSFFGHYHHAPRRVMIGSTSVYHMTGMEMGGRDGRTEVNSVGVLRMTGSGATFEYVDPAWLRGFTRFNWKYR